CSYSLQRGIDRACWVWAMLVPPDTIDSDDRRHVLRTRSSPSLPTQARRSYPASPEWPPPASSSSNAQSGRSSRRGTPISGASPRARPVRPSHDGRLPRPSAFLLSRAPVSPALQLSPTRRQPSPLVIFDRLGPRRARLSHDERRSERPFHVQETR